ncbi:lanthionine synthetase C family protein [Streptomyces sp. NPDC017673]|uniref:lanthionine synthetase C family protein n=1 Tax=unclassified Streptomyces TaxID=2593676 RepID=UPI0037BA31EA
MSLRDDAAHTVASIARQFSDVDATTAAWHATPRGSVARTTGLAGGLPGMALLFAELSRHDGAFARTTHRWLTQAARARPAAPPAGLYDGTAALCFAAQAAAGGTGHYADTLARLDLKIAAQVRRRTETESRRLAQGRCVGIASYDVITGLTGLGALTLSRGAAGPTRSVLDALVALTRPLTALRIAQSGAGGGRSGAGGMRPVPGWWVAQSTTDYAPAPVHAGHANLGLAHGIAGPLALLSLAWREGVRVAGQRDAVHAIVRWLREQRLPGTPGWPAMVTEAGPVLGGARLSWCYGTPGVARALYLAGSAFGQPRWRQEAVAALKAVLPTPSGPFLPGDPGLCHGRAGLLHITARMAADTGDAELRDRLDSIARHLLDLADGDTDPRFAAVPRPGRPPEDAFGLLSGTAGVALALHAYATGEPPRSGWDRALLVA